MLTALDPPSVVRLRPGRSKRRGALFLCEVYAALRTRSISTDCAVQ
jgi:hypothetical protein